MVQNSKTAKIHLVAGYKTLIIPKVSTCQNNFFFTMWSASGFSIRPYLVPCLYPYFDLALASHAVDGHFYADDSLIYLHLANVDERD